MLTLINAFFHSTRLSRNTRRRIDKNVIKNKNTLFLSKHQQLMEYLLKITGNVHICAVKQIMVNNLEVMDDSKGPLISKGIFGAFKSTKKATIFLRISALVGISSLKNQV